MRKEYGKISILIFSAMALAWSFCGCAYLRNQNAPQASAAISDQCTTATLQMGAIGEFSFVCSHARRKDGTTTGSVQIHGSKDTIGMLGSGIIGAAIGYITGGAGN